MEKLMMAIDDIYRHETCTRKNDCKHQFWSFNSFEGRGRYCCALSKKIPSGNCIMFNGTEECNKYEKRDENV